MKSIQLLLLISIVILNNAEDFVCRVGVSYIANDCSDCVCAPNGNFGCTLKACVIPGQKQTESNCIEGTTFQQDCNKCWCVKHGGVICENEDCSTKEN